MANRNAAYKQKKMGFGNVEQRRIIRAIEETQSRRVRRSNILGTRRRIQEEINGTGKENSNATQQSQADGEGEQKQDRKMLLMKWKAKKELEKQIKKQNQLPAFRAGLYHHKLNSPIFLHQTLPAPKPPKPPSPRRTRATAKRIAARNETAQKAKTSVGPRNKTKSAAKKKILYSSFAPRDHQFRAPDGLSPILLFGQEALEDGKKEPKTPAIYFSPYVVSARGKRACRQEQLHNIEITSKIKDEPAAAASPEKLTEDDGGPTPAYFRSITEKEVTRLRSLCQHWFAIKTDSDISEDAKLTINQVIGQTNLLIEKKIEQFKQLIVNCEDGSGENVVTPQDLQGFWDMVYLQVENCDSRFAKLIKLQERNWEEEEVVHPKTAKPLATRKLGAIKKVIPPKSSSVRDMIRAARRQHVMESRKTKDIPEITINSSCGLSSESSRFSTIKFDGGFFVVESPNKAVTPKSSKKSMLLQKPELSTEHKHRRSAISSIEVSQKLKFLQIKPLEVESDPSILYINSRQTPGRSILKQAHSNDLSLIKTDAETMRIKKQLIFQNDLSDTEADIQEPDLKNQSSENSKTLETNEAGLPLPLALRENSTSLTVAKRRSHRRMVTERNKKTDSESAEIEEKDSQSSCPKENSMDNKDQKENEQPVSPDVPKRRRSSRKSVKFTGDDCTACSEVKLVYPMTPRSKRGSSKAEKKSTDDTIDLISWDTPEGPLPRVRRSLRLRNAKQ